MEINSLHVNNIKDLDTVIAHDISIAVSGWSGSGKSSFCDTISAESLKRLVTTLPKSEYSFLYKNLIRTNFGALYCKDVPFIQPVQNKSPILSMRSTVGTSTGIFKSVRRQFAKRFNLSTEYFSFNIPINWCKNCKGRGSLNNIICKLCDGTRFDKYIKKYSIALKKKKLNITDVQSMNFIQLQNSSNDLEMSPVDIKIIENIINLGIGYLNLGRAIKTLSGGEYSRLLLSKRLGLSESMLYVIDEPSLGLDQQSIINMIDNLSSLGKQNQLMLIDHSKIVVDACQRKLFFGPESGSKGGKIVKKIPLVKKITIEKNETLEDKVKLENLCCRNIDIQKLELPLNRIVSVTGESGCGKTTLMRDCVYSSLTQKKAKYQVLYVSQSKSKSVTSRSTLATFLGYTDILKKLYSSKKKQKCDLCSGIGKQEDSLECNWCMGTGLDSNFYNSVIANDFTVRDILQKPIFEIVESLPHNDSLKMLVDLGGGYLSLNRSIRTLSNGEFQRVHLAKSATIRDHSSQIIFIFDEPSRGLSQNYLNAFVRTIKSLVASKNITIWMIEHNPFLLECSDFIFDFGKRTEKQVTKLQIQPASQWHKDKISKKSKKQNLISTLKFEKGTRFLKESNDQRSMIFQNAKNNYYGLLKELSPTASWIYGGFESTDYSPSIAIDFEEDTLYSEHTFLFEVLDISGLILNSSNLPHSQLAKFDLMDKDMLCRSCKGKGVVKSFDFSVAIKNKDKGLWEGLLHKDIMDALKNYNYSKIKFLFKEVKKAKKIDLEKVLRDMNQEEERLLWYGLWDRSFHHSQKNTYYMWKGLNHLIQKYMRSSKSPKKELIKKSFKTTSCPACKGSLLYHNRSLSLKEFDFREHLGKQLGELQKLFPEISVFTDLEKILPSNTPINTDVSSLSQDKQVSLKIFEIAHKRLYGYKLYFNNILPFINLDSEYLKKIEKSNEVNICDDPKIKITKEEIFKKNKLKESQKKQFVWEFLGYKKINTQINKVKKNNPCSLCKGKGKFEIESPEQDIDKIYSLCESCQNSGINSESFDVSIDEVPIRTWLFGNVCELHKYKKSKQLRKILLSKRLNQLPKYQVFELMNLQMKN